MSETISEHVIMDCELAHKKVKLKKQTYFPTSGYLIIAKKYGDFEYVDCGDQFDCPFVNTSGCHIKRA